MKDIYFIVENVTYKYGKERWYLNTIIGICMNNVHYDIALVVTKIYEYIG